MKVKILPLMVTIILVTSMMATTASAVTMRAISGRPTLKISGTTAYCVGKYSSGNKDDEITITLTLKQGTEELDSWSASGKGSVVISKTYTVTAKKTYALVLTASVNGVSKPGVTVTATGT
jgi:hypothetical protein